MKSEERKRREDGRTDVEKNSRNALKLNHIVAIVVSEVAVSIIGRFRRNAHRFSGQEVRACCFEEIYCFGVLVSISIGRCCPIPLFEAATSIFC